MTILAYISGHGFGHWTRSEPVLARLAQEVPVHVRTNGRVLTFVKRASWPASVEERDVGPGVVQGGPLDVDLPATRRALEAHLEAWPAVVREGVEEGRALGARLIFGDVPPVAFAIGAELGLGRVALCNFSWSWIYDHYAARDPFFGEAASRLRAAEGMATTRLVPLPGGGGLESLGAPTPSFALRRLPTCSREEARARIPRPPRSEAGERPLILLSFGGYGDALDLSEAAGRNPELDFLCFAPPAGEAPDNLRVLPHDHDLPHQDLVLGADALVAKVGYGTVSECLNGPTPMVYVEPSGEFREHPRLVEIVRRWLPCEAIDEEALLAGDWGPAIERARASSPPEQPPPNELERAAERVREQLLTPPGA